MSYLQYDDRKLSIVDQTSGILKESFFISIKIQPQPLFEWLINVGYGR